MDELRPFYTSLTLMSFSRTTEIGLSHRTCNQNVKIAIVIIHIFKYIVSVRDT